MPDLFNILQSPVIPWAMLATVLVCGLLLFVSLKRELLRLRVQTKQQNALFEETFARFERESRAMRDQIADIEQRASLLVQPPPTRSGLNMSKRTQVLRMIKRGDQPEQISAALRLPQNEIRLMFRVFDAPNTKPSVS